ncbi:hypothetical protein GGI03_003584 [Coemansia sp. RSA 2337]|nr:hypothetical protein GGI03_003584 [Coemansia sp. RSA 2337]
MDGKLVIIISLDQETVAPNTDPVANAHLATLSTASGSTVVAQGSSLTLHSRPASAATRPGTHIRSPALSAGSNSAGGSRVASPTANIQPSSAVARPANNAHLAARAAASSLAGVARGASPAMGMRPSAAATRSAVARPPAPFVGSSSADIARGSPSASRLRPASAATHPGTCTRPQPPSAGSSSSGVSRATSPAANIRPSSAVARPASTAHLATHPAALSSAGIAHGASPAMGMRPSAAATRPAVARPPAPFAGSSSAEIARGSPSASRLRPASAATHPGTRARPQPPSAGSSSAGISQAASPAANIRQSSAVARPANNAHLAAQAASPAPSAALSPADVSRSASPVTDTRPSVAATHSGTRIRLIAHPTASSSAMITRSASLAANVLPAAATTRSASTRPTASKGRGKGKGRPRQGDTPEPLPVSKYLAVDETDLLWDDDDREYSPDASSSAVVQRALPSQAAQSGREARGPVRAHGSTNELRDALGIAIDSDRVSRLLSIFTLMSLDVFPTAYERIFGHSPLNPGTSRNALNQCLARLEGFTLLPSRHSLTASDFLLRQGAALMERQQHLEAQLWLASNNNAVVPLPLLCFCLITLACMPIDDMTGLVLSELYRVATKHELGSLQVVTENGVEHLNANMLCERAKQWARELQAAVVEGNIIQEALAIATKCNQLYLERCGGDGAIGVDIDLDGRLAAGMLANNTCLSVWFLGVPVAKLKELFRYFEFMLHR